MAAADAYMNPDTCPDNGSEDLASDSGSDVADAPKKLADTDLDAMLENQEDNTADYRERLQQWSSGLFDCHLDCFGCIRTCLCHPFVAAEAKTSFNESHYALNACCALCCPFTNSVYLRHQLRVGYGINGNAAADLFVGIFCYLCNICQLQREIVSRGGGITCGGPVIAMMKP